MKEFVEFSKDDQKLICEALRAHNEACIEAMKGKFIDNSEEFKNIIHNMSYDAKEYMVEILKRSLPEEYQ